jgi:hypothetical protein
MQLDMEHCATVLDSGRTINRVGSVQDSLVQLQSHQEFARQKSAREPDQSQSAAQQSTAATATLRQSAEIQQSTCLDGQGRLALKCNKPGNNAQSAQRALAQQALAQSNLRSGHRRTKHSNQSSRRSVNY